MDQHATQGHAVARVSCLTQPTAHTASLPQPLTKESCSTGALGTIIRFYTEPDEPHGPAAFLRQLAYTAVVLPARQVLADALPCELMERCGMRLLFVGPEVPDSLAGSTLEVGAMHMHFVQVGYGHCGSSREVGVRNRWACGST